MAVKTLGYFWDRLKLGLQNDTCSLCKVQPRKRGQEMLCTSCEARIRLRQPEPSYHWKGHPIYSGCQFSSKARQLIYGLKFYQERQNGLILAEILIHYWQQVMPESQRGWIVVPIPAHENQSDHHLPLIARPFASHFGYDFMENGLQWTRSVQKQHTLASKRRRRENVSQALEVSKPLQERLSAQTKILIVDDLLTTGSTLIESFNAIHRASPNIELKALTIAHVPFALSKMNEIYVAN